MATAPFHGKNAVIRLDANVITNANEWSMTRSIQTVEATQFGTATELAVRNLAGMKADSGTITGWQPIDAKILHDASGTEGRLWIYPNSGTMTAYWYGNVLFTDFSSGGSTTSGVSASLNWVNGNTDALGMRAFGFS